MNSQGLHAFHLNKRYKKRLVVRDLSLNVQQGEIIGLLGPNGAGKTTSFYMIVGLVACDYGIITLDGEDISQLPMHARAHKGLGYLPQEMSVFRKLTVKENILSILETCKHLSQAERQSRLAELLNEFHLTHVENSLGMSLSGGERRRVEIARALATDPKFVLLDEPFAGVDPISVIDIKHIIEHLKARGIGILITDHNVRETLDVCDRAYILHNGVVLTEGQPEAVLAHQKVREVYLGEDFAL